MDILFCGYRNWASEVRWELQHRRPDIKIRYATTPEELTAMSANRYDFIVVVGWSWKIEDSIIDNTVIGMHPSKLPDYAGGSPIQNQIIDGLKSSEATLFRLSSKLDGGDIISSEPYSLEGHLDDVFYSLKEATTNLLLSFIEAWPNIQYRPQAITSPRRRLKPEQSHLTRDELSTKTCSNLYDLIRCREDPYPNVYIEDETGRLIFKVVEFEPKQ